MEHSAPSIFKRAHVGTRRHVLLFWIAAALALVGFGLLPRELRQELQRYRVVKLAPEFNAQGQGFAMGGSPLFSQADPEFSDLPWLTPVPLDQPGMRWVQTSLLPVRESFYLYYAGFPKTESVKAWLVAENTAGEQTPFGLDLENQGGNRTLTLIQIPKMEGMVGVRLACAMEQSDRSFSFSAPFLLELSWGGQLCSLLAQGLACLCAAALLFLPGLALRLKRPELSFALLPLPGMLYLSLVGLAMWVRPAAFSPHGVALALTLPVLLGLAWLFRGAPLATLTTPLERRVLVIALLAAGLAVAKAGYSLGPKGELYHNQISRSLEVGDRSDSRVSYHITQLVFHGQGPYSERARRYFHPWSFSSRGPLPGLAAATLMGLADAAPPWDMPDSEWRPFDAQGFVAYRIAMLVMGAMAFVMFFGAIKETLTERWAFFATAVAATTPFLLHEVYFTWPKLQAAGLTCAAVWLLARRRPLASGLCLGLGYLVHPLVLLSGPVFACLAVFNAWGERSSLKARTRATITSWLWFGLGLGLFLLLWRVVNWPNFTQNVFWNYLASGEKGLSWLTTRLRSVGNTLIPLRLYLLDASNPGVNAIGAVSPGSIHFFFQYWNTAPFGFGILAAPALLFGLYQAARLRAWQFCAFAIPPFLLFSIFWGCNSTGMLREGLHVWVLSVIYLFALGLQTALGRDAGPPRWVRDLLWLRVVEILALLILPVALTQGEWLRFPLIDAAALTGMAGLTWLLGRHVSRPPDGAERARD
jgi:hypothetical protein